MRIEKVAVTRFPPFDGGEISLPGTPKPSDRAEVQFLVGPNGAGKTRLLSVILAAIGNRSDLAARLPDDRKQNVAVLANFGKTWGWWSDTYSQVAWSRGGAAALGTAFSNVREASREEISFTHPNSIQEINQGAGLGETPFALAFEGSVRLSDEVVEALRPLRLGAHDALTLIEPDESARKEIAQGLANIKTQSALDLMNGRGQSRWARMANRIEEVAASITGRTFVYSVDEGTGGLRLRVRWGGDEMSVSALPDGLRSILGWLAACVVRVGAAFPDDPDPLARPIVALLDEPEGHLHPKWQRQVLPAVQRLLPNAQIIVATHSPFVIASVNEGWIHIFRPDEAGKVTVEPPRPCAKGDSYLDVVEDILGVDEWFDPETERMLAEFRKLRDHAANGGTGVSRKALELADEIGARGPMLADMMAREKRKLAKAAKAVEAEA